MSKKSNSKQNKKQISSLGNKDIVQKVRPKKSSGIPKEVANRMARRIAITTGLPTFSGMGVFIVSYLIVSRGIAEVPPSLTLTASAGFFLMGLVGLSYGILSASWEESSGSILGLENIGPNITRMKAAFSTQASKDDKQLTK